MSEYWIYEDMTVQSSPHGPAYRQVGGDARERPVASSRAKMRSTKTCKTAIASSQPTSRREPGFTACQVIYRAGRPSGARAASRRAAAAARAAAATVGSWSIRADWPLPS